jgi:short-subunit dehydrogenase
VHPGGIKTNIAVNARTTVTDPARLTVEQKRWENLLKMPPEEAATIIIRGIERNSPRILIGNDARLLDTLARLSPAMVGQMLANQVKK